MIEEKLSKRVTVVLPKSMNKRLIQISEESGRTKSGLVRWIVKRWLDGVK
jgi:predicted DNA-binding protein